MSNVEFAVTPDKKTTTTRLARGTAVATQGPLSTLYVGTTKAAVDDVVAQTASLKTKVDTYNATRSSFRKAASALGTGVVSWDASYDVLISTGAKICLTSEDGAGLGLPVLGARTKYVFAMPISVLVTQNIPASTLRIHVKRAPGMKATCVETSPDPTNPALWKELEGDGAVHRIPAPPPGMIYVRAAARNASQKSAFTTPVSFLVK